MSEIFHYATDDGIATITWDQPGASMNVLNEQGIAELDAHVDAALADSAVTGVIITSGKRDFAGGMDLNVIARMKRQAEAAGGNPAETIFGFVMGLHGLLRKIERAGADPKTRKGGKPFVCLESLLDLQQLHRTVEGDGSRLDGPAVLCGQFLQTTVEGSCRGLGSESCGASRIIQPRVDERLLVCQLKLDLQPVFDHEAEQHIFGEKDRKAVRAGDCDLLVGREERVKRALHSWPGVPKPLDIYIAKGESIVEEAANPRIELLWGHVGDVSGADVCVFGAMPCHRKT